MNEISAVIKRLGELGMSQKDIERHTGIPQPRLSRWNGGSSTVANDALKLRALLDLKEAEIAAARVLPATEG